MSRSRPGPTARVAALATLVALTALTALLVGVPHALAPADAATAGEAVRITGPRAFPVKGRIEVRGTVTTQGARRPVLLQERKKRRWVRRARKRTSADGTFRFRVKAGPTARNRTFRVTAPAHRGLPRSRQKRVVKVRYRTPATVRYGTRRPLLGKPMRVSGRVRGKARGKRKVLVQLEHWDGWKQIASGRTKKKGRFAVRVPSGWLYDGKVRVRVAGSKRGLARTVATTIVAVRPTWGPGGHEDSWSLSRNRHRWNPCAGPITYRINLDRAPLPRKVATQLVHRAVAEVAAGTGLRFKYLGTSKGFFNGAPGQPGHEADTRLLVGWGLDHEVDQGFKEGVLGYGGGVAWAATDALGPVGEFESGGVVINAAAEWTRASTLRILMHELGHAVGLQDIDHDPEQVMHATLLSGRPNQWGAGDLAGLHWSGRQLGCTRRTAGRGAAGPVHVVMP